MTHLSRQDRYRLERVRGLLIRGVLSLACLSFLITPSLGVRMAGPLTQRFERVPLGDASRFTGIIALEGGNERLKEAARLQREHPHLKLLISGTLADVTSLIGEAEDGARIIVERTSSTTWENAVYAKAVLAPQAGERWLLVTSAVHMPRSIGAFRRLGFNVEPWPVYDLAAEERLAWRAVRHEWAGLLFYWLRGRSEALFPAPEARWRTAISDNRALALH